MLHYERPQPSFSFSLPLSLHPSSSSFSTALLSGRRSVAMVISIAVIATSWWGGPAGGERELRYIYIPEHSEWLSLPAFIFLTARLLSPLSFTALGLQITYKQWETQQLEKMLIVKPLITTMHFILSIFCLDILCLYVPIKHIECTDPAMVRLVYLYLLPSAFWERLQPPATWKEWSG